MSPAFSASARAALMAPLDEAMGQAARDRVNAGAQALRAVVAVDLHLSFVGSGAGPWVATAQVIGGGKTMVFCEAQLRTAEGVLVAQAMGTYRACAPTPELGPEG